MCHSTDHKTLLLSRFIAVNVCVTVIAGTNSVFLWLPCIQDADIIFLSCGFFFFLSFFYLFFLAYSRHRRLVVYHTSTHGVALVRILNACLKCAVRGSLQIQDAKSRQKSPSGHHRTTLSGYIFATKVRIDNQKKTK